MIKVLELAMAGTMALTTAAHMHPIKFQRQAAPATLSRQFTISNKLEVGGETIEIYYSPLSSTKVASYVGLGMAYHMAIVYTDRAGRSFGASSGPSNMTARQAPADALTAIVRAAYNEPSSFGTLASDPHNDTGFIKGQHGDFYTHDDDGHAYPRSLVSRGQNLSGQWSSILRTYRSIDAMHLTYSPMNQNSNSLAGAALRRAGLDVQFSSDTVFAPGVFTALPEEADRKVTNSSRG